MRRQRPVLLCLEDRDRLEIHHRADREHGIPDGILHLFLEGMRPSEAYLVSILTLHPLRGPLRRLASGMKIKYTSLKMAVRTSILAPWHLSTLAPWQHGNTGCGLVTRFPQPRMDGTKHAYFGTT